MKIGMGKLIFEIGDRIRSNWNINDKILYIFLKSIKNKQMHPDNVETNGEIEDDHFPLINPQLMNVSSIVNSDAKAIHDKLNNYEKLDTE